MSRSSFGCGSAAPPNHPPTTKDRANRRLRPSNRRRGNRLPPLPPHAGPPLRQSPGGRSLTHRVPQEPQRVRPGARPGHRQRLARTRRSPSSIRKRPARAAMIGSSHWPLQRCKPRRCKRANSNFEPCIWSSIPCVPVIRKLPPFMVGRTERSLDSQDLLIM